MMAVSKIKKRSGGSKQMYLNTQTQNSMHMHSRCTLIVDKLQIDYAAIKRMVQTLIREAIKSSSVFCYHSMFKSIVLPRLDHILTHGYVRGPLSIAYQYGLQSKVQQMRRAVTQDVIVALFVLYICLQVIP